MATICCAMPLLLNRRFLRPPAEQGRWVRVSTICFGCTGFTYHNAPSLKRRIFCRNLAFYDNGSCLKWLHLLVSITNIIPLQLHCRTPEHRTRSHHKRRSLATAESDAVHNNWTIAEAINSAGMYRWQKSPTSTKWAILWIVGINIKSN